MTHVAALLYALVVSGAFIVNVYAADHAYVGGTHRIAFGSCANPNKGGKIWRNMQSEQPQHLILLGDVMYTDYEAFGRADENTPAKIHREYAILAADQHWQDLLASVQYWSATYDDHDYGVDNGDKTFKYRDVGMDAFRKFAKNSFSDEDYEKQNGVFSAKVVNTKIGTGSNAVDFTYKVILLDSRSNKDRKGTENGDFLGEEQWAWLAEQILDPSPDLILLGSSIQVFSDDKLVEESWSEFPQARERLLKLVTAASTLTNVVLLSGDIHRAEVSRATCTLQSATNATSRAASELVLNTTADLWELTSSGLSHTLRYATNDTAATASGAEYASNLAAAPIPLKTRSWFATTGDKIYQFAYSGYYREDKEADSFAEIHYALLDIVPAAAAATSDHSAADPSDSAAVELHLRVVSHAQEVVIHKNIPLRSRQSFANAASSVMNEAAGSEEPSALLSAYAAQLKQALLSADSSALKLECVPYWGVPPVWRVVMYRAIISMCLLLFVVLPVLGVLWLIGASVYYICIGSELARRDEIERRYQKLKKQD